MKKKTLLIYTSILFNILFLIGFYFFYENMKIKNLVYYNFTSFPQVEKTDTLSADYVYKPKVCFIGNSITANWINLRSTFFKTNAFVNRGVGGQTSTQVLLRFQQDVISIQPDIVVINIGINDIGEGDGFYNQNFTIQNIKSMIDLCKANDIEPLLSSILPATEISLNRFKKASDVQSKIELLNKKIKQLANTYELQYVDYNVNLKNNNGTFNELYTFDGVHPNEKGYEIMEKLVLEKLQSKIYEK